MIYPQRKWEDFMFTLDMRIFEIHQGGVLVDVTDRYILMEYTGVKDKANRDIYEGDIVKSVYPWKKLDQIAEVVRESSVLWFWGKHGTLVDALSYNKDTEIIGNIFEHPMLSKLLIKK